MPARQREPIRALHVLAPARAGGLEAVVLQSVAGLRALGHDIRVAVVLSPNTNSDHPFLNALNAAAIPSKTIVVSTRDYRKERRAVHQYLQEFDARVLHTHGYRPDVVDGGVARTLGIAHVTTLHGFVGGSFRGRVYEWLQVRAAAKADAAIAVSSLIADRLHRAGARHVHMVRNAVFPAANTLESTSARSALALPAGVPIVGWVGRLSREKGPDVFVRAIAASNTQIHGAVVGEGPLLDEAKALAVSLGISERIHFVGLKPEASRYLSAFDALALTSRTEGTPMILLEAMSANIPIVATTVGGVPDVLSRNDALLCDSEAVDALALAFNRIIAEPALRTSLATSARERVATTFAPERWIDSLEQIYESVVTSKT